MYIDSSEPSPGGTGKWTKDDTLTFECKTKNYKAVSCDCQTYKVFHLVYTEGSVPDQISYLMGKFKKKKTSNASMPMLPTFPNSKRNLKLSSWIENYHEKNISNDYQFYQG